MSGSIPNPQVTLTVAEDGTPIGTLRFEVFRDDDIVQAALNFVLKCRGYLEGHPLSFARPRPGDDVDEMAGIDPNFELEGFERELVTYSGARISNITPGQYLTGGDDITVYGDAYECTRGTKTPRRHVRGTLGIVRNPGGESTSKFYVVLAEVAPWLDGTGIIIGQLVHGEEVLAELESLSKERVATVVIIACDQL